MTRAQPLHLLLRLFVVSVLVNAPWEIGQAFLYEGMQYSLATAGHCLIASLGDGVLVCSLYAAGWVVLQRADWFARPGWQRIAVLVLGGLAIGVVVEWVAVYRLARWSYTPQMPLIPGLGVGVVPVLQMVLLPATIFTVLARA